MVLAPLVLEGTRVRILVELLGMCAQLNSRRYFLGLIVFGIHDFVKGWGSLAGIARIDRRVPVHVLYQLLIDGWEGDLAHFHFLLRTILSENYDRVNIPHFHNVKSPL